MCGLVHRLIVISNVVHASTVEDLLLRGPVRNVVASCLRKSLSGDQLQTASLLQECVMVRDGLANLPDCFTACDK